MKRALATVVVAGIGAIASLSGAHAALCVNGATLDTFLSGSCSIGDKTFSNFTYSGSALGGATAITADAIVVRTLGPAGSGATFLNPDIGFQFSAPWTVGSNQALDSLIQFDLSVNGGPQLIKDAGLVQSGTGFIAPGIASIAENLTNSAGNFVSQLLTIDTDNIIKLADNVIFDPLGFLHVVKDLSVNGNNGGAATISMLQDTFSQTPVPAPEPGTVGLLVSALIGFGLFGRTRRRV